MINMGRTIISKDGRFEWDEEKSRFNKKSHGFSFDEVLEVFDDPIFIEGYDSEHSGKEERYYGIGCLNNILYIIVFYTLREGSIPKAAVLNLPKRGSGPSFFMERKRIISARRADKDEEEIYNDYFKKIKF